MLENDYLLVHSDCLTALRQLPDNSVDSIVTDPPYGLSFMGKKWDYDVPGVDVWAECLRVLKPGGHLLAFAGTRTQHRMAVRIEDAGFEIRDMIAWVYGSGFPKSLDVSKALDDKLGGVRSTVKVKPRAKTSGTMAGASDLRPWIEKSRELGYHEVADKNPITDAARQWQGWGTALKPALEPITVARKPLVGTVAENVLAHGTGAINVDGCRVGDFQNTTPSGVDRRNAALAEAGYRPGAYQMGEKTPPGRWPANLIHDGSDEVVAGFPDSNGGGQARKLKRSAKPDQQGRGMNTTGADSAELRDAGTGSAARFFYCAKAGRADRGDGNTHPTVKPTELMRYLVRLVTQPGGVVLDPFMGSGSTGKAAILEGFRFIGIDMTAEYVEIARARIQYVTGEDLC